MHHFQSFRITRARAALYSLSSSSRQWQWQTRNRACLDCRCNEGREIPDVFQDILRYSIALDCEYSRESAYEQACTTLYMEQATCMY